jgi:hypothetical protein
MAIEVIKWTQSFVLTVTLAGNCIFAKHADPDISHPDTTGQAGFPPKFP